MKNAVVIPDGKGETPSMDLAKVVLVLRQRYSHSRVAVLRQKGGYRVEYERISRMSHDGDIHNRDLTPAEAAWMERRVRKALKDTDQTTWQSMPGGDRLTVEIQDQQRTLVSIGGGLPQRKYTDLQTELKRLAVYGSISGAEKS